MNKRPKDGPFGALTALRGKVRESGPLKPAPPKVSTTHSDADDLSAFRKAVAGTVPLAADDHAPIERARPSPVPRPRPAEPEPEAPPRRRNIDPTDAGALFREAMDGVAPLADSGRIDIGKTDAHRKPRPAPLAANAAAHETQTEQGVPLPPLPENEHDPAALFRRAVGEAAPLPERNRATLERPQPPPRPRKREEDEAAVLRESIEAPLSFEDRIDIGDEGVHLRAGLPRRILTDLRRGRWVVQAELDLHGLTRDEARSALGSFLHEALEQGYRCVRLIHGKGLGSPGREPVLKHLSRGWLIQREEILAFCQARPHDGGEGALLILLHNTSKKG
jgi:DNA-nicking Smr family endonuclease